MGGLIPELREFLDGQPVGVLATTAPDGYARQSLVYFARDDDRLLISTLADRLIQHCGSVADSVGAHRTGGHADCFQPARARRAGP